MPKNNKKQLIEITPTTRGFMRGEFVDLYGQRCSIQESSLATDYALWLGVDINLEKQEVHARMHLDIKTAKALIKLLEEFCETGRIGKTCDGYYRG